MKKFYTLFIVFFGSILFGQEYRPLLLENNVWEVSSSNNDEGNFYGTNYQMRLGTQTLVHNAKEYTALEIKTQPWNTFGNGEWSDWGLSDIYFHESIENKVVYIYYSDTSWVNEPGEYLLYDFNLQVGDMIPTQGFFNHELAPNEITITAIDYQNVFGLENIKTFHVDYDSDDVKIYEGIGSLSGLFSLCLFKNIWRLQDFTNTLGLNEQTKIQTKIYPNPFSDKIQIKNSEEIIELQLFDLQGKIISTNKNLEELNSKLSSLNNAVYFLKIQFKNNKSETIKLIKNK